MRDPNRPTDPPPPLPRMRPKQPTLRDGAPPPALSDRELLLQVMAEFEKRQDEKLEQYVQQSQRPAPPVKRHNWGDIVTKLVAALSLIGAALAGLKPTKDDRVDKAYEDLAKAVRTVEAQQQRSDASVEALRAWLAGYFNATGVKTVDPPGAPPPARVELLPTPMVSQDDVIRPGGAPAIQVRTPLPAPPPSSAPIKLAPKLAE